MPGMRRLLFCFPLFFRRSNMSLRKPVQVFFRISEDETEISQLGVDLGPYLWMLDHVFVKVDIEISIFR